MFASRQLSSKPHHPSSFDHCMVENDSLMLLCYADGISIELVSLCLILVFILCNIDLVEFAMIPYSHGTSKLWARNYFLSSYKPAVITPSSLDAHTSSTVLPKSVS